MLLSQVAGDMSEVIIPQEERVCRPATGNKEGYPGSTLLLKLCPVTPFLNFHISQHVSYPKLLMSQTIELFSLPFLGYSRRW